MSNKIEVPECDYCKQKDDCHITEMFFTGECFWFDIISDDLLDEVSSIDRKKWFDDKFELYIKAGIVSKEAIREDNRFNIMNGDANG